MEVRRTLTVPHDSRASVREYHKALLIAVACSLVLAAGLVRAYVQAPRPLTSADVLAATRRAVDGAVDAAIRSGGLVEAEAFVEDSIAANLESAGFGGGDVNVRRPNDLGARASFYWYVELGELSVRFELEGTRDPLLAIRLGLEVRIHADPYHPYATHGEPGILAVCLAHRFYHLAAEGPDFFARLENRTRDPYYFGFETFLVDGDRMAVDHAFLETGSWGLDATQRERYGL